MILTNQEHDEVKRLPYHDKKVANVIEGILSRLHDESLQGIDCLRQGAGSCIERAETARAEQGAWDDASYCIPCRLAVVIARARDLAMALL